MKQISITAILLVILSSLSCSKKNNPLQNELQPTPQFQASFFYPDTKTFVDENLHLFWTADDRISVFSNTLNTEYVFNGKTGDNSGTFSKVPSTEFATGSSLESHYAVYPFFPDTAIEYDGSITVNLPASQEYAPNSFGQNANLMVAVTENINDYFLFFKNACGYLKINLYGNVMVRSIRLKGNRNETLAGPYKITSSPSDNPTMKALSTGSTSITLNCPNNGVAISATQDSPTPFWIVVPPTSFENGFEITVTDTEGNEFTKKTTQQQIVSRNVCLSMPAISLTTENVNEVIDLGNGGSYNSFIVSRAGYYRFSVGSRIGDSAFLLWNENGAEDISNVIYNDGYVYFKKSHFDKGNAVISVSDNGTIVWSWHIWTTDFPQTIPVNGIYWMDRNMGATSTVPGDENTYGLAYNPGNPFPFPGPKYSSSFSITTTPSVPEGWYVAEGYGYYRAGGTPKPSQPMQLCSNTDAYGNSIYFRSRYNQFPEGFHLPGYSSMLNMLTYEPSIIDNGVYPAENLYLPCIYGNMPSSNSGRYMCSGIYNTTAVDTYAVYFYNGVAKMTYCEGAALMPIRGYQ